MMKLAGKFARSVLPGVIKPLHVLWNEMIGFVFFVFAVVGLFNAFRYWRTLDTRPDDLGRTIIAGVFGLIMACFAFGSFRRARGIAKR